MAAASHQALLGHSLLANTSFTVVIVHRVTVNLLLDRRNVVRQIGHSFSHAHGHILQSSTVRAKLGRMLATFKVEVGAHLPRRLVAAEDAVRRLAIGYELVVNDLHARCRLIIVLTL